MPRTRHVAPSRWRRFWTRLWLVAKWSMALAGSLGLIWGGMRAYRLVRDADYFRLRTIRIEGNAVLTRDDVLYLLALPSRTTLLQLDLQRMGARLERHPYVRTVTLRRYYPDTLAVSLQERSPYLVVVTEWESMVVDREGVALHAFRPDHDARLPQLNLHGRTVLAPGMQLQQREVLRALELIRAYKRVPLAERMRLASLTVEESGASLWQVEPYPFRIRVGEGQIEAQLQRLPPVLNYIEQRSLAVRLVDVSYRQRVVVTLITS